MFGWLMQLVAKIGRTVFIALIVVLPLVSTLEVSTYLSDVSSILLIIELVFGRTFGFR